MKIGSHVNNNGELMLEGSIKEALNYGANCFMVYLGAPQNTLRKNISELKVYEMQTIAKNNGINLDDIIVHAPYIVNPARMDEEKRDFAISFLTQEVLGVEAIGAKYLVLHPGSAVDSSREDALLLVADCINNIIKNTPNCKTVITIETMAGKGNEVGKTFEEVATIISYVKDKERIGVCLDTCHINDGGYDIINNYDEIINKFDKIIGLSYLKVIHVNDSKNPIDSHKDRHENIGFGNIGFDALMRFFTDKRLENIPHILETPYVLGSGKNSYPPYKEEIIMIKSGIFNPNLKEEVIKNVMS